MRPSIFGNITIEQFDEIMRALVDVPRVIFVNVKAPRPWEVPNNEVIADGMLRYPKNGVLADWQSPAPTNPNSSWTTGSTSNPKASASTPT